MTNLLSPNMMSAAVKTENGVQGREAVPYSLQQTVVDAGSADGKA